MGRFSKKATGLISQPKETSLVEGLESDSRPHNQSLHPIYPLWGYRAAGRVPRETDAKVFTTLVAFH